MYELSDGLIQRQSYASSTMYEKKNSGVRKNSTV